MVIVVAFTIARAGSLPAVDPAPAGALRPTRDVAVVVGVERPQGLPAEPLAGADASTAAAHLATTVGLGAGRVTSFADPTRSTFERGLGKAVKKVGKGGTVWVWAAGAAASEGLVLSDGVLPWSTLQAATIDKRAARVVWVLDVRGDGAGRATLDAPEVSGWALPDDPRLVVWMADDGGQAQDLEPAGHGLFTWLVAGAMRGWADGAAGPPDGQVTLAEAQVWVRGAARSLGRPVSSSIDPRPEHAAMVLTAGVREPAPTAALASAAVDERAVRVAAAVAAREAASEVALDALIVAGADRAALTTFVAEESLAEVSVRFAVVPPAVQRAREVLAGGVAPKPAESAVVDGPAGCADLVALEPMALGGKLPAGALSCLDERLVSEQTITTKDKISRLLIVDAEARGDLGRWEQLVVRHAETIDGSDPDLCLKLASWYFRNGGGQEVIVWADRALENKRTWTGDAYTGGLYRIFQLKAETAYRMWTEAQVAFVSAADRNAEAAMEKLRGDAKNYAKEWMDFAFAAGRDHEAARQLCLSAAGSSSFCGIAAP